MDLYHRRRIFLMSMLAIGIADSALAPMRPIFEATEEVIPLLGNPLGGGTPEIVRRNIKLHVTNQQKIFNRQISERMKAQRQQMRSLEPQDSYLKAYHEQHEQFHIDLEKKIMDQMVSNKREAKTKEPIRNTTRTINNKKRPRIIKLNEIKEKKEIKIDKNLINPTEIFRNKRLDVEHFENRQTPRNIVYSPGYFLPMKRIHVTPNAYMNPYSTHTKQESATVTHYVPTHQFNVGDVNALTSAALKQTSNGPNQYSQLNGYYEQNKDIGSSLSALIGKQPDDQLKGLTYLLQQSNSNHKVTNADLKNTNINFKASSIDVPQEYYDKQEYKSPYTTPLNSYQQYIYGHESHDYFKDHTPIIEPAEEVKDSKYPPRLTSLPTSYTYVTDKPTTTSYYKVEVSNQVHHEEDKNNIDLYNPTPSYSYTSGHDNVSIEVKNKLNKNTEEIDDDDVISNLEKGHFNSTIPFGAKLRPKKNKNTLSRHKRQINNSFQNNGLPSFVSNTNSQFNQITKLTPRISNTNPINFTNTYSTNKLKMSVSNSFSLHNTTHFSNNILRNLSSQINCSECFKSNGESEFYYYDDASTNTTDELLSNDDFPLYDDLQNEQKGKTILKSISADSRESKVPHSEALKVRLINRPRLYRVVNGIKMRVKSPNAARYRKFLIKKPVRFFYNRYANAFNENYDQIDYGDDYNDEYYDYEEFLDDGKKTYDPYEDYASQSQYASGYNYFDDYIPLDVHQKGNRFNKPRRGKGKNRYASNFDENTDYINDDAFNDYTRNVRNRLTKYRYPVQESNAYDYDYPQNTYIDNYDDINGDEFDNYNKAKFQQQESQFQNYNLDKGYSNSYGTYFDSNSEKKKKPDPSNFYVENYNQYVSKPNQYSQTNHEQQGHQKPISVFNIFRNEPSKNNNLDKHKLVDDGDVIHIDNVNVYPNGRNKGGWKGPKKPPRHLPYKPHRPIKHRRRKPSKWRGPRPYMRRTSNSKRHHMLANLSKLNRLIPKE